MAGVKSLNGAELAGFVKERQRHEAARLTGERGRAPRLVILRDSHDPVIEKYVGLKKHYGKDTGIRVDDVAVGSLEEIKREIKNSSGDINVDGIIVQLPLQGVADIADYNERMAATDEILREIAPEKDVDDLTNRGNYDGATATAINWLLAGYDIDLTQKKIAIVGYGRLVGKPLKRM